MPRAGTVQDLLLTQAHPANAGTRDLSNTSSCRSGIVSKQLKLSFHKSCADWGKVVVGSTGVNLELLDLA